MTTFNIRPARRDNAKLLIGLAGPTGSGKTYSALLLAAGIVDVTGGRIVGVDTESGRMLQYAPPGDEAFEFDYLDLKAPFRPDRYQDAYEAAEQHAGPGGVVVVDSMSHEHEGPGGILEWHDEEVDRLASASRFDSSKERYNFPAWSVPKAARRRLINRVLQSRCHVIFCFRAKEKNVLVDKPNGKGKEIVNIGWSPITGDEWPYEMTIFALLSGEKKGVPIIDGFSYGKLPLNMRSLVSTEVAITSDTGRKLAKWAGNGHRQRPDSSPNPSDSAVSRAPVNPRESLATRHSNGGASDTSRAPSDSAGASDADLRRARGLYAAIRDAADLSELGALEHENDALIKRLDKDVQDKISVMFKQRLAELTAPQSMAQEIDADGDEEPEWGKRAAEINAEHEARKAQGSML